MINIDFQYYVVLAITLIVNAFFTGIGITLGVHFANKNLLKSQEKQIDEIVEKVLERMKEEVPKELNDD